MKHPGEATRGGRTPGGPKTRRNHLGNTQHGQGGSREPPRETRDKEETNINGEEAREQEGRNRGSKEEGGRTIDREDEWRRPWGNRRGKTPKGAIRIQTININTFPKRGSAKMTRLRKEMEGADITGLSELNKNHYKLNHLGEWRAT